MANFNIQEGTSPSWEEFKKYYFDVENYPNTKSILQKISISERTFQKWSKEVAKETGRIRVWNGRHAELQDYTIEKKPTRFEKAKFYYWNNNANKFVVVKQIDGKATYFGIYSSKEDAEKIVRWCKQNNWDKELFNKLGKKEVLRICDSE